MPGEVLFEQGWPVDEDALRRGGRRWVAVFTPLSLLGALAMAGLHGAGFAASVGASGLLLAVGLIGWYLWSLTAHIRRSTRLSITKDGTLHVSAFPKRHGSFALRQCREVSLRKVADHRAGSSWVYRYDLVVVDADRKHEFMLPGRIGRGGNWSTLSEAEAAAFHAAVGRFASGAPR